MINFVFFYRFHARPWHKKLIELFNNLTVFLLEPGDTSVMRIAYGYVSARNFSAFLQMCASSHRLYLTPGQHIFPDFLEHRIPAFRSKATQNPPGKRSTTVQTSPVRTIPVSTCNTDPARWHVPAINRGAPYAPPSSPIQTFRTHARPCFFIVKTTKLPALKYATSARPGMRPVAEPPTSSSYGTDSNSLAFPTRHCPQSYHLQLHQSRPLRLSHCQRLPPGEVSDRIYLLQHQFLHLNPQ